MPNESQKNVVEYDGVELPKFVLDILSLGPKHSIRDRSDEVNLLANEDRLVREFRDNNTDRERLREIELSVKWYSEILRENQ